MGENEWRIKRGFISSFYTLRGICNKSNIIGMATDDFHISSRKSLSFFENPCAIKLNKNPKAKKDNNKNKGRSDFNQNNSSTPQLEKNVNRYIIGKEKHIQAI